MECTEPANAKQALQAGQAERQGERDLPSFSIVMPTYKRRDVVCDAVRSLGRLDYVGPVEIIVAIDGSNDGTAEALADLEIRFPLLVLQLDHGGAAHARNRGAEKATGDIILFLDDDMMAKPDLLDQHAKMYRDGADAVSGDVFMDPDSPPSFVTDAIAVWLHLPRPPTTIRPFDVYTGQLSVRRSAFKAIGGFDESFTADGIFGHEDTDFGAKLIARFDVRHNPDALTWQRYVVGPAETMKRASLGAVADARFVARYPQLGDHLFDQRGRRNWKTRYVMWPLSRIPFAARIMGILAVWLAEAGIKSRFRSNVLLRNFFFMARGVNYWSALWSAGGMPSSRSLLILCYHSIQDHSNDRILADYSIPPEQFAAQLQSLAGRGFVFIGPEAFAAFVSQGVKLPRRSVLLTFDDCYADLTTVARDVLRPRAIEAVAFAVTGTRSGTNEWDQPHGAQTLRLLGPEELRDLAALGIEVGAHSRSHRRMPELSAEQHQSEAAGAAADLADCGLPRPRFFAFPYGANDAASRRSVKEAGYLAAFGVDWRLATQDSDPFRLPRVPILASDKGWRFRLKTASPRFFRWGELNVQRAARVIARVAPTKLA